MFHFLRPFCVDAKKFTNKMIKEKDKKKYLEF